MYLVIAIVIVVIIIFLLKGKNDDTTIIGEQNAEYNENLNTNFDNKNVENIESVENAAPNPDVIMFIEDIFSITGRGTVVTGTIENNELKVGDEIKIKSYSSNKVITTSVVGIQMFRKSLDIAKPGENVGVLLSGVKKDDLEPGSYISK